MEEKNVREERSFGENKFCYSNVWWKWERIIVPFLRYFGKLNLTYLGAESDEGAGVNEGNPNPHLLWLFYTGHWSRWVYTQIKKWSAGEKVRLYAPDENNFCQALDRDKFLYKRNMFQTPDIWIQYTVGIWIPTTRILETFEYWDFEVQSSILMLFIT